MAMATNAPITTIHQGIDAGRLKASSTPVTTADQFPMVSEPPTRNRWIRYSNNTQHATLSAVTRSTSTPNTTIETTSAGISAITTSRMILAVDCEVCTCGAGATTSLFAIISFCFSIYFFGAAARARIMPMTVCFPRRTQSSSGRYEGHEAWQQPHSMHEVIICASTSSQPFFWVIFER